MLHNGGGNIIRGVSAQRGAAGAPLAAAGHGRDPVDVHIGARLKLRRREVGLSQTALARQLEVTFQQVCKYERGDNRISAAKLFRAADVLSCPVSFFFEGLARGAHASAAPEEHADRMLVQLVSRPEALRLRGELRKLRSSPARRDLMRLMRRLAEEKRGGA